MTKPIIRIHNQDTGEIIDREMNDQEFTDYQSNLNEADEQAAIKKAENDAKLAILEQLGLTNEQAITLGLLPQPAKIDENANKL